MNRSNLNFLVTLALAILASFFMPWWSVMVAAFIAAILFDVKGFAVFLAPFTAIFLYWMGYAFFLSNSNDFILAEKIALLLPLGGSPYALILLTAFIGGLAAGMAGVFGKQCSVLVKK